MIKGWTEAMQLMVQGDKWEMYIPYELAYGASGRPPKIPGCAMLIFVMEIVKIKGDSVPRKAPYPEWSAEELALWLEKDEAACSSWRAARLSKWEAGDEKLVGQYATREALDEWLDSTCTNTRNKTLWKRTRAAKKKAAAAADAPAAPAAPPPLTAESARALLTKALEVFTVPSNKEKLAKAVAECATAPPESAAMMKMMKLLPLVSLARTRTRTRVCGDHEDEAAAVSARDAHLDPDPDPDPTLLPWAHGPRR